MSLLGIPGCSVGKESAYNDEDTGDVVSITGWENPLKKEIASLSTILAWEISWTEGPGEL